MNLMLKFELKILNSNMNLIGLHYTMLFNLFTGVQTLPYFHSLANLLAE